MVMFFALVNQLTLVAGAAGAREPEIDALDGLCRRALACATTLALRERTMGSSGVVSSTVTAS